MHRRHWTFLATIPYAAALAYLFGVLFTPGSGAALTWLLPVSLVFGVGAAAALVYGGGYDRLGVTPPGPSDFVEVLVLFPLIAVGYLLTDRLSGTLGFLAFLVMVVVAFAVASRVSDAVVEYLPVEDDEADEEGRADDDRRPSAVDAATPPGPDADDVDEDVLPEFLGGSYERDRDE